MVGFLIRCVKCSRSTSFKDNLNWDRFEKEDIVMDIDFGREIVIECKCGNKLTNASNGISD